MISVAYLSLLLCCLAYSFGEPQQQEEGVAPAVKDEDRRPLTDTGLFRFGDPYYVYPSPAERSLQSPPRDPTFTNEIDNQEEPRKRPLFIFTTYDAPLNSQQLPPNSGPYIEIRRKRSVEEEKPQSSTIVGALRKKRSHCNKCGGGGGYGGYGGGGGYYPVASYQVYPVYTSYPVYSAPSYPSYGGGGGCYQCGKGGGGFGGGGNSGSWSKSSSSSKSSSGSWGYGK